MTPRFIPLAIALAVSPAAAADLPAPQQSKWVYRAPNLKSLDGDSFKIPVLDGSPLQIHFCKGAWTARFYGVDTAEKNAKCPRERALGKKASEFTAKMIPPGRIVELELIRMDKYPCRVDVIVRVDGRDMADVLISQPEHFAKPYFGKKKSNFCKP